MEANSVFFEPRNLRFDPANIASKIKTSVLESRFNRALFITKVLRLQKIRKGHEAEKLVPSTNLFNVFGLTPGQDVTEEVIGEGQGMVVRLATSSDKNTKKIYSRRYKNREEIETLMDIRHQTKIKSAFAGAKKVHLLIEYGKVTITPIIEGEAEPKHLWISFDADDKKALYSVAAKTLKVINGHKFASVTTEFSKGYNKDLVALLDLQLRRQGYSTVVDESTVNAIYPCEAKSLENVSLIDFKGYEPVTPNIDTNTNLSTFVACTGGVDAHLLELDGYTVTNLMDFCPTEERDLSKTKHLDNDGDPIINVTDKTERCLLNALANTGRADKVGLFNEDFFISDIARVVRYSQSFNFYHFSPCCQDYSPLKSKAEREKAIKNLTASRDMVVPALTLIEQSRVPTVLIENVVPYGSSLEANIAMSALSSMGYEVHKQIVKASTQNCMTNRDRFYVFASLLPEAFTFPAPEQRTVNAWDVIKPHLTGPFRKERGKWANDYLRDVSHTKAIQNGIDAGRSRFMTEDKNICPVIPRCQSRQVKDSVYVANEGAYFYPRVTLQRDLMGIPDSFDLSLMTDEVSTEIIGNSVEAPQHTRILSQIKEHIVKGLDKLLPKGQVAFQF